MNNNDILYYAKETNHNGFNIIYSIAKKDMSMTIFSKNSTESLNMLGRDFKAFYNPNTILNNCTAELLQKGYRPLDEREEKILVDVLRGK